MHNRMLFSKEIHSRTRRHFVEVLSAAYSIPGKFMKQKQNVNLFVSSPGVWGGGGGGGGLRIVVILHNWMKSWL